MDNEKKGILLESGTNEMEVVIFGIGEGNYGINVMKVREIINPLPVIYMPHSHPFVEGIAEVRGETVTVIDLSKALGLPPSTDTTKDKFIISEFNNTKVAFHVHSVSRIYRVSWEQIEKPNKLSQNTLESATIGVLKMNNQLTLLLDFEKIVVDINPEEGIKRANVQKNTTGKKSDKNIVIAEDSAILRKLIKDTLEEAGYYNLTFFEDGRTAWEYLKELNKEEMSKKVDLIITDIEMPQMDGHHLTKNVKDNHLLNPLPVIIFSSLITEDLKHKGVRVGANSQVSKPEIADLVRKIDELLQ